MIKINRDKELLKNTGILAIGNICTKALSFFLLPLYTSIFSTEEYGIVDLLTTYVTLLVPIVNIQLSQSIFRFVTEKRDEKREVTQILSAIYLMSFILIGLYCVFYFAIKSLINLPYMWYLIPGVILNIMLQLVSYSARGIGDNIAYSIGNFISGSFILIFNVVFLVVFHLGIQGMIVSYCLGPLFGISVIVIKVRLWQYIDFRNVDMKYAKKFVAYSLPLVPNELSWWVLNASDKVIITHFLGLASNGLISVASKFSNIYSTVFSIFNASWTEQVVLHYHDDDGELFIRRIINKAVRFFIALNLGIIAIMPFVFPIMVNSDYGTAYDQIMLFLVSVIGNLFIGLVSPIYLVNNETKKIAQATLIAAVINLVVDIALVNWIGIYAAAISSICGYGVVAIMRVVDIQKRYFKLGLSNGLLLSILFAYLLIGTVYLIDNKLFSILGLIFVIFYSLFINRELLYKIGCILKNYTK